VSKIAQTINARAGALVWVRLAPCNKEYAGRVLPVETGHEDRLVELNLQLRQDARWGESRVQIDAGSIADYRIYD
jgi:hypothetical protein